MKHKYLASTLCLLLALGSATSETKQENLKHFNRQAQDDSSQFYDNLLALKNMHADFKQVLKNPSQGTLTESNGQMWVSKPSYFKWQTLKPSKQLLLSDGNKLWNYDVELEQVTISPVPKEVSQAPYLLLLSGKEEVLQKLFNIRKINNNTYQLTPKDKEQSLIEYIDFSFNKDKTPGQMVIQTGTGQSTSIHFSNISCAPVNKNIYQFTPPKGVDILGE